VSYTFFWIGNHSLVLRSTRACLFTLCVCIVLTLPNAWIFPHFLCCSTLSDAANYQNPLRIYKTDWQFCGVPLRSPWFTYTSYLLPCPTPFSNPEFSIGVSSPICDKSGVLVILRSNLFAWGCSAMVLLFVPYVTPLLLVEVMKIGASCFTYPRFRRILLNHPGTTVVILISS